jgi:crossover junction endodeoxyribonuclease RuvC
MLIVGIDPGLAGAIAVLDGQDVRLLVDLPVHRIGVAHKKALRAELDLHTLHALLAEHAPYTHAFVEKVAARPGQGTVSMFRFGVAFGSITGLLVAMGVPMTMVQPKDWQRHHGIGPAPDAARQRAVQLYPQTAPQLARKCDAHKADALLLAVYGRHGLRSEAKEAAEEHPCAERLTKEAAAELRELAYGH